MSAVPSETRNPQGALPGLFLAAQVLATSAPPWLGGTSLPSPLPSRRHLPSVLGPHMPLFFPKQQADQGSLLPRN